MPEPPPYSFAELQPIPPAMKQDPSLTTGRLLDETFRTFWANLLPFTLLTAVLLVPVFAAQWAYLDAYHGGRLSPNFQKFGSIPLGLLSVALRQLIAGALAFGVFQRLRGKPASFGESVSAGMRHLVPVFGVAVVTGAAVMLGYLLCFIPGVIADVALSAAVPAAIVEGLGVRKALTRSDQLTNGYRWQIFGLQFLIGLFTILLAFVADLTVRPTHDPDVEFLARSAASVLGAGMMATAAPIIYFRLRTVKEAFDTHALAEVFD